MKIFVAIARPVQAFDYLKIRYRDSQVLLVIPAIFVQTRFETELFPQDKFEGVDCLAVRFMNADIYHINGIVTGYIKGADQFSSAIHDIDVVFIYYFVKDFGVTADIVFIVAGVQKLARFSQMRKRISRQIKQRPVENRFVIEILIGLKAADIAENSTNTADFFNRLVSDMNCGSDCISP